VTVSLPGDVDPVHDGVLVVDFGAQYAQLIARRVRECHVYSEIVPHTITASEIRARAPRAVILSGGPASVYAEGAPQISPGFFDTGVPTFGICYGFQAMAASLGGVVARTGTAEYGRTALAVLDPGVLLSGLPAALNVWMSHGDAVTEAPPGFTVTSSSGATPVASFEDESRGLYGVQFHPEVLHSEHGQQVLKTSCSRPPAAARPGRWSTSSRTRSPGSASRSATSAWSAACRAGSTRRWPRPSCSEPWLTS